MSEPLTLFLSLAAGVLLGVVFFAGLLWTISKGLSSKQPALWFSVSLLLRMSITLLGFYFVSGRQFQRLMFCLLGFVMTGFVVTWLNRESKESQICRAQEVPHAPQS